VFYFNQILHNLSNQFFKNIILIKFKRIQANYLYVYQTNFSLKISHMQLKLDLWFGFSLFSVWLKLNSWIWDFIARN